MQHVDLITFTMSVQGETLPSAILGDAHIYASICVPLHLYIRRIVIETCACVRTHKHTHTHIQHGHTKTISFKRKIFQVRIIILQ